MQSGPALLLKPVTVVDTPVVPMSPLMTVRMPWLVMPAEPPKMPKGAALPKGTSGGTGGGTSGGTGGTTQLTAVKLQLKSLAMLLPGTARSRTPVAVPRRWATCAPASIGASGVKVAMRPVATSSTTEDASTLVPPGPVSVKLPALIVAGSMRRPEGTAKVALMASVRQTLAAPSAGLVDATLIMAGAHVAHLRGTATGVSTTVTGFNSSAGPDCIYTQTPLNVGTVNGRIYTAPPPPRPACPVEGTAVTLAVAQQARADALIAYNQLVAMPPGSDPGAGSLSGLTLAPGVYTAAGGSFRIQGSDLTLDGQGNANATWVFQMATSLTVGGPGAAFPRNVILINGAQAKNVFWQVGSAATINAGGGGTMVGTIISQAGAAFSTAGALDITTLNGRVLSLGPSVTVVNTVINVPAP